MKYLKQESWGGVVLICFVVDNLDMLRFVSNGKLPHEAVEIGRGWPSYTV